MMLYPERRLYNIEQASGTMVAIYSTLREDLYVVYAGMEPGDASSSDSRVFESAGEVDLAGRRGVVLGTLLALMPNRRATCWCFPRCSSSAAAMPGEP